MKNENTKNYGPFNLGNLTVDENGSLGPKNKICELCKKNRPTYLNGSIVPCDACRAMGSLH